MKPWVASGEFDIDLSVPVERRHEILPPGLLDDASRALLDELLSEVSLPAATIADQVRRVTDDRFQEELIAMARHVNVSWQDLLVANVSYDLAIGMFGCSTAAIGSPFGPILFRNLDWWPERPLARCSCLLRFWEEDELRFANAGWPGIVGCTSGLSGRGFAVALNAVTCEEGVDPLGYPVLLHIRRVLEDARGFDSAVGMLTSERLAAPCLLTIVGLENDQRAIIERTPSSHVMREADGNDEPLVATNHYRAISPAGDACPRYDALLGRLADLDTAEEVDDEALLGQLTDPNVIQTITAQHVIMRPRDERIGLFVPIARGFLIS